MKYNARLSLNCIQQLLQNQQQQLRQLWFRLWQSATQLTPRNAYKLYLLTVKFVCLAIFAIDIRHRYTRTHTHTPRYTRLIHRELLLYKFSCAHRGLLMKISNKANRSQTERQTDRPTVKLTACKMQLKNG